MMSSYDFNKKRFVPVRREWRNKPYVTFGVFDWHQNRVVWNESPQDYEANVQKAIGLNEEYENSPSFFERIEQYKKDKEEGSSK